MSYYSIIIHTLFDTYLLPIDLQVKNNHIFQFYVSHHCHLQQKGQLVDFHALHCTGFSLSEVLILASISAKYDDRFFIQVHEPFRKENDRPMYLNVKSDHPNHIIKHIPIMIERRISNLSSTEEIFDTYKVPYEEALKSSGYRYKATEDWNVNLK